MNNSLMILNNYNKGNIDCQFKKQGKEWLLSS